jgi:hypothetical protein
MAMPKDRVDRIGVSGERSLPFRKAILRGPLGVEDEGNPFLRNLGKFSSMHTASHCKILQSSKNTAVSTSIVLSHFIVFRWPKVKERSKEALLRNNLWLATLTYFTVTLRSLK